MNAYEFFRQHHVAKDAAIRARSEGFDGAAEGFEQVAEELLRMAVSTAKVQNDHKTGETYVALV